MRLHAKALGLIAKNDPIDARLPSNYARACAHTLRPSEATDIARAQLRELLRARGELIAQSKNETNHARHPVATPLLAKQAARRRALS